MSSDEEPRRSEGSERRKVIRTIFPKEATPEMIAEHINRQLEELKREAKRDRRGD